MRRIILLGVCAFLFAAIPARADFYRWVDRDGKEFFTNDREKVPQEYRPSASRIHPDESRVSVSESPVRNTRSKVKSSEHRDKFGRGEAYWNKRSRKIRSKLRNQQEKYDALVKKMEDLEREPRSLNGKKNKSLVKLEKKKEKLEKDIAKTRRTLEVDLPDEARRADAYPGWLRE